MSIESIVYRIRDKESGLYYTGGIHKPILNDIYEQDDVKRTEAYFEATRNWTWQQKRDLDIWHGKHIWNQYYKEKWNKIGKIFFIKRGAEKALSELTKIPKNIRTNTTKNILFGNQKSINYEIVETKLIDIKPKEEKLTKSNL